jgi:hypothetical protein
MQYANIQPFTPPHPPAKNYKVCRNTSTYHKILSLLLGQEPIHSDFAALVYYFTGVAG